MGERRISALLIANRGEIARRVIRAARMQGIHAVAVFAADDRDSPHVAEADRAVALGAGPAAATYLDVAKLIAAAVTAGADAVHPGYGFLSEDPALAEACAAAGLVWVGPPPAAMRAMAHKAKAKETVAAAGVPVLPGRVVAPGDDVVAAAATVGYPLLVKASAGGGGRGMRLVSDESALVDSVAAARREAAAAFGSDEVFLERYLAGPRHVEVQVLADRHGQVVHLFDRECSVQRRHQKVIEEAPAALVPESVRGRMWAAAVTAARAVGYEGAGTVEFLVDGEDCFFLEMNTRLQVEHGVTELVTGLDLVRLQLDVAAGSPLPFSQDQIVTHGHAVEARLCAEVPVEDYRPAPGPVVHVRWPAGEGVRVDAGVESGSVVSAAYDSLVAKVMAWGDDRGRALGRLRAAMGELELDGIETNRRLLAAALAEEDFVAGDISTAYLETHPAVVAATVPDDVAARQVAAAALALEARRAHGSVVPGVAPSWRNMGVAHHVDALHDGATVREAVVERRRDGVTVSVEPGAWRLSGRVRGGGVVEVWQQVAGAAPEVVRRYRVREHGTTVAVNGPEGQSTFTVHAEGEDAGAAAASGECRAPLPGAVTKVLVAKGDAVEAGAGLVVLEAMKMEHTLRAGTAGTVDAVHVREGQQVDAGVLLVVVEPA
jgi:acetyl-CoA/propionyl-CoA carboxylase biotin carboxyl carrier protein